jgi:hypothetical protein
VGKYTIKKSSCAYEWCLLAAGKLRMKKKTRESSLRRSQQPKKKKKKKMG